MALTTTTDADFTALVAKVDAQGKKLDAALQDLGKFTSMLIEIGLKVGIPDPTSSMRGSRPVQPAKAGDQ